MSVIAIFSYIVNLCYWTLQSGPFYGYFVIARHTNSLLNHSPNNTSENTNRKTM